MRSFHVSEHIADYVAFETSVNNFVRKFKFKYLYYVMLQSQKAGSKLIVAYAACKTDVCLILYLNFLTYTNHLQSVNHIIGWFANFK